MMKWSKNEKDDLTLAMAAPPGYDLQRGWTVDLVLKLSERLAICSRLLTRAAERNGWDAEAAELFRKLEADMTATKPITNEELVAEFAEGELEVRRAFHRQSRLKAMLLRAGVTQQQIDAAVSRLDDRVDHPPASW